MSLRQHLGRVGRWPRLVAAAACLLLAAVTALEGTAAAPGPASHRPVVVATRMLPAGHVLSARDLTTTRAPTIGPVVGRPGRLIGRTLAGPLARGEPVTTLRLLAAGLTTGLAPGTVALPVDVATDVRGLVAAGGRVDLLAVPTGDAGDLAGDTGSRMARAQRVADRVLVLAALPADSSSDTGGCRLVLALSRDDALRITGARATRLFQVAALPP